MPLTRREFLGGAAAAWLVPPAWAQSEKRGLTPPRIIYYINFASHLLCAFNPNMYYPELPYRWSDEDWRRLVDMIAHFGFNVFEFWLEPRLFCREAINSPVGRELTRQLNADIEHAHARRLQVEMIVAVATVGEKWRTLCPNLADEWREIRFLWDAWLRRFPDLDIAGIFPGDPGACSRNGCTAETYIDKSIEIAATLNQVRPGLGIEFNTWRPPFFGWGNLHMPPDSRGEFIPADQGTAWTFSKERADRAMGHLLKRLADFPANTVVSINLGFNGDGNPQGEQDARPWANAIAKTRRILTWDFSLTEGENAVYPHYRFTRLFARRKEERAAAPYCGGICFTMTPMLNQLSLFEAAQSFKDRDGDPDRLAGDLECSRNGKPNRESVRRNHSHSPCPTQHRLHILKGRLRRNRASRTQHKTLMAAGSDCFHRLPACLPDLFRAALHQQRNRVEVPPQRDFRPNDSARVGQVDLVIDLQDVRTRRRQVRQDRCGIAADVERHGLTRSGFQPGDQPPFVRQREFAVEPRPEQSRPAGESPPLSISAPALPRAFP